MTHEREREGPGRTARASSSSRRQVGRPLLALLVAFTLLAVVCVVLALLVWSPTAQTVPVFLHVVNWPPPALIDWHHPNASATSSATSAPSLLAMLLIDGGRAFPMPRCASHVSVPAGWPKAASLHSPTLNGWHISPPDRDCAEADVTTTTSAAPATTTTPSAPCASVPRLSRVLLFLHGNGANRAHWVNRRRYAVWTRAPFCFDVFVFDYTGFGENGGWPTQERVVRDAERMYEYVTSDVAEGGLGVSPSRLLIHGHSLGSGVAAQLVHRLQRRPRDTTTTAADNAPVVASGLILEGAFTSVLDVAETMLPAWLIPPTFTRWYMDAFGANMAHPFRTRSVLFEIAGPVLLLHGGADDVIPPGNALDLCELLTLVEHDDDVSREQERERTREQLKVWHESLAPVRLNVNLLSFSEANKTIEERGGVCAPLTRQASSSCTITSSAVQAHVRGHERMCWIVFDRDHESVLSDEIQVGDEVGDDDELVSSPCASLDTLERSSTSRHRAQHALLVFAHHIGVIPAC